MRRWSDDKQDDERFSPAIRGRAVRRLCANSAGTNWALTLFVGAVTAFLSPSDAVAVCVVGTTGTVTCQAETTTTLATNIDGATRLSSDRVQLFGNGSPIDATIAQQATISGAGLRLTQAIGGGLSSEPVRLRNHGVVTTTLGGSSVRLDGNGAPIIYNGNGYVTNTTVGSGWALFFDNTASRNAVTTGIGAITGARGIYANAASTGSISMATGAGEIASSSGYGIEADAARGPINIAIGSGGVTSTGVGATAIDATSRGEITVTANGPVTSGPASRTFGPPAIQASSNGAGNIVVGGTGTVTAYGGRGIWAEQGATGTGSILVTGTGGTFGMGAICPATAVPWNNGQTGCSGIRADISNPADASSVIVDRSGNVAVRRRRSTHARSATAASS